MGIYYSGNIVYGVLIDYDESLMDEYYKNDSELDDIFHIIGDGEALMVGHHVLYIDDMITEVSLDLLKQLGDFNPEASEKSVRERIKKILPDVYEKYLDNKDFVLYTFVNWS